MLGMGGGACAPWKVVHDPPPNSSAKRGQSHGKINHAFRIPFEILHVIQPCGYFAVLRIFWVEGNSANGDAVPRSICRFQWDSDDDPQSGEASAGSPPFLFFHFLFHNAQSI